MTMSQTPQHTALYVPQQEKSADPHLISQKRSPEVEQSSSNQP